MAIVGVLSLIKLGFDSSKLYRKMYIILFTIGAVFMLTIGWKSIDPIVKAISDTIDSIFKF